MLPKKLKSKQGVTLPVAMAVTCVLIILSVSLIGIALTSITNTSSSVSGRQAYLNARSALEYAITYYSDTERVPELSEVHDEYMVMKDKDGGTTNDGALFVADESETEGYATYVHADYYEDGSSPQLKITAYALSSNAFGKKARAVTLGALMPEDASSSGDTQLFPPPEIVPASRPTDYVPPMNAITLHVKQYPGQNWTPFYYLWTYKDVADLYSVTDNCYGLETYYKSRGNLLKSSGGTYSKGPLLYYKKSGSNYVKAGMDIPAAFTLNHKSVVAPSPWNAVGDLGDPRNGPATSFSAGDGGWYSATYYIDDANVNYFNLIITKKGQVLNVGSEWHPETQTSEMFHLWYLFSSDKNVYFEFLKPGLQYKEGKSWNGLDTLSDRMLVYVKNKKTTVHFRVKGIGDTEAEANSAAPTNAPVINSVSVKGVSIFDSSADKTDTFVRGNSIPTTSDIFNTSSLEQVWLLNFMKGNEGRTGDEVGYFYGVSTSGQDKMLYEGCGWWVANISCGENFDMTFTYYDKEGNATTDTVSVSPNTDNEAFVVVDPAKPGSLVSRLTERRACDEIGLDYESYTTIKVKASETATTIAPYLDYENKETSSTAKRILMEKVDEVRSSYLIDDYEDAGFNALQDVLNEAIELLNDTELKADSEYNEMVEKIDEAISNLRTKVVSREIYKLLEDLVKECDKAVQEQSESYIYDGARFASFVVDGGVYTKTKNLVESGEILKDPSYTSSVVLDMKDALEDAFRDLQLGKLEKSVLEETIKEAKKYQGNTRYKQEYLDKLDEALSNALDLRTRLCTQEEIDTATEALRQAIDDLLANPNVDIDLRPINELLENAQEKLDNKVDCTDDTYSDLQKAVDNASAIIVDISATQEKVDAAYEELLKAYNAYTVYKPGSGTTTTDSYATDTLLHEGKVRIWVEGVLRGTVIRSHKETANGPDIEDEDAFEITGFSMQLFRGGSSVGNYNYTAMNTINGQGLMYRDLELNSFDSVKFTITAVQNELGEYNYSTGHYDIKNTKTVVFTSEQALEVKDTGNGNLVYSFGSFVMADLGTTVKNTVVMNTDKKLSELYISGTENAVVEVTNGDGKRVDYPTIEEGPYRVARYLYDASGSKKQKVQIRYYSIDNSEYLYTDAFDSQFGQYVVLLDETNKTERSTIKINIPYNSKTISGDDTTFVGVSINGADPVEANFDGSQYVYTADYSGEFSFTIVREYGEGGKLNVTTKNSMLVNRSGELNVTYDADDKMSANYTTYTFKTVPYQLISVKSIYPMYSETSGSGSTVQYNSVGELSGIVSTTFTEGLLTTPKVTSATTTMKKETVSFDYFNQVPTDKGLKPTKNLAKTVIWIDTNNSYLNKQQPWVYVWDRNDRALNGTYPGMPATRVEDTNYYYVVVDATAIGLIITKDNGATKVGGTPKGWANDRSNNGGEIYLDITDSKWFEENTVKYDTNWKTTCYGKAKELRYNAFCRPFQCNWGDDNQTGGCCLFTIIDAEVLSADGHYETTSSSTVSWSSTDACNIYDYHASTGNKCPNRQGHGKTGTETNSLAMYPYAPGKVENYSYGSSIGGAYKYFYRAKRQDEPPTYETLVAVVDRDDMDAKDLRMPFVGGSKIKLDNISYANSYSTYSLMKDDGKTRVGIDYVGDYVFKSEDGTGIDKAGNQYGGNGGNRESMGRVGDTTLSLMYDWYERKIPVDQSSEYTFQIQGLRFKSSNGKEWYETDYKTDTTFTERIKEVYGNVWLVVKDITMKDGLYTNMALSSVDPENIQIEDEQKIYVKKTTNIASVQVVARGIGSGSTYTMSDDTEETEYLSVKIPSQTPFLTITINYTNGTSMACKTSLQGGDNILFDPSMNAGTGGWNNFVPKRLAIERALYSAHALYYGKVLAREYDDKGNPKNLGDNGGKGSYKYAGAFKSKFIDKYFTDGDVNSNWSSASLDEINQWVAAYTELYATMSEARAYVPGHNYPEYLHGSGADIYSAESISKIERLIAEAENVYESDSTTVNDVVTMTSKLEAAVQGASINTSDDVIRFFFCDDTGEVMDNRGEVTLKYQLTAGGTVQEQPTKFYTENGNYPSFYVTPATGESYIYNAQFVIRYPNGEETICDPVQAEIPLSGRNWYSDWYFIYQPSGTGTDLSRWHREPVADVRTNVLSKIEESTATEENYIFDMKTIRPSFMEAAPAANSEASAMDLDFQDLYIVFKEDVTVVPTSSGIGDYTIYAGAYRFTKDGSTGPEGPLVYAQNSAGNWVPRLNLFTQLAKDYFTNPVNYGEYVYPDDGGTPDDYIDGVGAGFVAKGSGDELSIIAGSHMSNKTVNMTVNNGSFAANRLMQFMTSGRMYFRWRNSGNLNVYNNVTMLASELTLASSGKIVSHNADKHFYLGTFDDGVDSMELVILTDLHIQYIDRYGDTQSFIIRRGVCKIKKDPDDDGDYIADLFDKDYWSSSHVQYHGTGTDYTGEQNTRFGRFGVKYVNS